MAFFRSFKVFNRRQYRIFPVFVVVCSSVITVPAVQRSGCFEPLGMESHKIKDSQLSSKTHDSGWDSSEGRLNNGERAWCSDDNTVGVEYFDIDLLKIRHVSAIATQGVRHLLISYYVKTYVIMYSFDQGVWFSYQDGTGNEKIFTGNSDANGVKKNNFRSTFVTRYLRIFPFSYNKDMCLRVELYGCQDGADDCSHFFTSPTGFIRSPGYPASYPPNVDCTWLISVKSGTGIKIALLFTQFDVASGSDSKGCNTDFVSIQSGLTELSSQIGDNYCNVYKGHKPLVVTLPSKTARIHFHSDGSSNSHKGFKIAYLLITPGTNDVFADTACDRHYLMLNCSTSAYTINILYAYYGSYPLSCGQGITNVSCQGSDTKNVIISKCQDLKTCQVFVSGSMFAHNCPDGPVHRQLEVFYQCTSRNIRTPLPPIQGSTTSSTIHISSGTLNIHPSLSVTEKSTELKSSIQSTESLEASASTTSVLATPSSAVPGSSCYGNCVVPQEGDKEGRTDDNMPSGLIAGVIGVVGVIVLVGVLIAVFVILKRRRLKIERSTIPAVRFSSERQSCAPTNDKTGQRCPLSENTLNTYETVNLLYESCSSPGTTAHVSENPLYESVSPPAACGDNDGYEIPQCNLPSKVKSMNNPNYETTLPLKNHDYAVPEC